MLRLVGGLFALFEAGVAAFLELALELFDSTGGVNVFQFAGVKWVTRAANVDLKVFSRAAGFEFIATPTRYGGVEIFGVDAFFHDNSRWWDVEVPVLITRMMGEKILPTGPVFGKA